MGSHSVIDESIIADEIGLVSLLKDNYLAFIGDDGLLYTFCADKLKCVHTIALKYDKCKLDDSSQNPIQSKGEGNA
jgi:hypothetical protein